MEMTSYTVTEDEGAMVEVCAIVHSPSDICSIHFPFKIPGRSTIYEVASNSIRRNFDKINLDNIFLGWLQCPPGSILLCPASL